MMAVIKYWGIVVTSRKYNFVAPQIYGHLIVQMQVSTVDSVLRAKNSQSAQISTHTQGVPE